MKQTVFYAAPDCPACETGVVGFFRGSDGKTLVLMCDECNAVWLHPESIQVEEMIIPASPDFLVPERNCALTGGSAGWATQAEIQARGWEDFIAGEFQA